MFFNTDEPGEPVQADPKPIMEIAPAPNSSIFAPRWNVKVPSTLREPLDAPGRPEAHSNFVEGMSALCGDIPVEEGEEWRWKKLLNFYHNCIRHSDRVLGSVLNQLDALGMTEDTIIVLTSDHGELGGAHGMVDKGPTAYKEQNHVPLIVCHPGFPATHNQTVNALTSHVDLAPSLVEWAAPDKSTLKQASAGLLGHSLTPLLRKGSAARLHEIREGTLYCFSMLAFVDSELMRSAQEFLLEGGREQDMWMASTSPDLSKRGAVRSVFNGRYKFNRYFSPLDSHTPDTLEEILEKSDMELFDLRTDPEERHNLAAGVTSAASKNADLVLKMNALLNKLLETEVGIPDDARWLPVDVGMINWNISTFDV